ncbi:MAG: septum site-determining protein MinD [Clostridia bacterium]|nr:septum site-determining protein MinD [Clostridia bacterium]
MGEVIVITSGKGGVGKTTSAANIGCALAKEGKKVMLLDADVGLRNLDIIMGLDNSVVFDFSDVLDENCRLRQAVVRDKRFDGLYFLAASQTKDKNEIDIEKMKMLTDELKESYDYVIIDCAAGIEHGFQMACEGADRAIVVATPEITSVRDADRVLARLEVLGKKAEIVINRVKLSAIRRGGALGIDEIIELLAADLIGIVPDDDSIIAAANKGEPAVLNKSSRAGQAYTNIAKRIMGEKVPVMDLEDDRSIGFKLKRLFSRKAI